MATAKDPVCGMDVDTDTDLKVEHDGETFYFCCDGCLAAFQARHQHADATGE